MDLITITNKMKVNLFFNHYKNKDRQHEIDLCLSNNIKIFDDVIIIEGRPTFSELFQLTEKYPNDINCFCNSDIYFNDLSLIRTIKDNQCFALTRYDLKKDEQIFLNRNDSQDAWIFKGKIKPIDANFTMGKWGCDNRLAYEIQKAGYYILNPSLSIVTTHVHEIDNRNYLRTEENTIKPPYLTLNPIAL